MGDITTLMMWQAGGVEFAEFLALLYGNDDGIIIVDVLRLLPAQDA